MIRKLKALVYRLGFRPSVHSILYSDVLAWVYRHKDLGR